MELKKDFTVKEISSASLSIPISFNENLFNSVIKSLEVENFKTTKTYRGNFSNVLDSLMPQISFNGKGFGFGLTKTKIASQFLEPTEFANFGEEDEPRSKISASELFTKEKLDNISSDFNYIIGLIFGKLGLDNKNYEISFGISLSKHGYFANNMDYLLKPESKLLFGKITDLHLKGFNITTEEELFGKKIQTEY
ncbi:MAG: hypothetical protein K8Q88_08000, partial [Nitrosarchaeum sp.]|nr:hypothetical protein [Nitrosarchaeum sp.]